MVDATPTMPENAGVAREPGLRDELSRSAMRAVHGRLLCKLSVMVFELTDVVETRKRGW
jgi:hypothetical protein